MKHHNSTYLVMFILSITLMISCTEKKEKVPAKETPVKSIIKKVDSPTAVKKPAAVIKTVKKQATYKNPYHIIIGSFTDKALAGATIEKAIRLGFTPHLVSRYKGQYIAVAIASFPDIHQAYNKLYDVQDGLGLESWVLFQENK